jgi:hypothetical protein
MHIYTNNVNDIEADAEIKGFPQFGLGLHGTDHFIAFQRKPKRKIGARISSYCLDYNETCFLILLHIKK